MRQGTIGYQLTPERKKLIKAIGGRLGVDVEQHGTAQEVIDFALRATLIFALEHEPIGGQINPEDLT